MSFDDSSCSSNPSSPSGYDDYEHFSGSSSPPPSSSTDSSSSSVANNHSHKNMLKSLQMKFTYLKEPRKRTRTTPEQLEILITFFDRQPCPSVKQRKQLAEKTGMTPRSIQVWFQNRRAKFRLPAPSTKKTSPPSSPSPSSSSPTFSVIPPAITTAKTESAAPYVPFQSFLVKQEPEQEQQQQQQEQQEQQQQALETSQSPISSPSAYSDASFESFEGSVFEPFAFDEAPYEDVKVIFDPFVTCSDDYDVSVY